MSQLDPQWTADSGSVSADSSKYFADAGQPDWMPPLIGYSLWDAIAVLEGLGVLVPASIGYFGTYPVSVIWKPAVIKKKLPAQQSGVATEQPGIVTAQSVAAGQPFTVNMPITLTVNEYPMGVVFP